jgi:glycosyltransferase involved in cell wall biosynthesis
MVRYMGAKPFSAKEQLEFIKFIRPTDYYWATSLSHPLSCRCKLISTVHDVAQLDLRSMRYLERIKRPVYWCYLNSIALRSRLFLFNSIFTRDRFYVHFPGAKSRPAAVTLLAPNIGPALKESIEYEKSNYFLAVANFRPHKNLDFLINAFFRNFALRDYSLKVVGGVDLSKILAYEDYMKTGRLVSTGFLPKADLVEEFMHAKAMIFPSLYEGFGLPAVEAMGLGCPVIASSGSSIPEVCGTYAFYFDPTSRSSFDQSISNFFEMDKNESREFIEAAYGRALSFTWDACVNTTFDAVAEVIDV